MMKYLKWTDPIRWSLTILIVVHVFMDAGTWVGIFAVLVTIHIELATILDRLKVELAKLNQEIIELLIKKAA